MAVINASIQIYTDTAANLTSDNPTLLAGQLAYESDTGKFKVGDGSTAWTSLEYHNATHIPFSSAIVWEVFTGTDVETILIDADSLIKANKDKLDTIETGATADQTGAEIKTLYEGESNTNAFTDSEKAKLGSIDATHYGAPLQDTTELAAIAEADITDKERRYVEDELSDYFYDSTAVSGDVAPTDQTGGTGFWKQVAVGGETAASIKTKYESNADTNAFTDADHSKLDGIEASADVTDATNVASAGALMQDASETIKGVLLPDGNKTRDLGSTGARFNIIYTDRIDVDSTISANNITVTGVVDGRDVSADGTTLDALATDFVSGHIETAANKDYTLDLYAPFAYTINELKIKSGSGTVTAAIEIDGTPVTGISSVSVTTSEATGTATAANSVSVGNTVDLVLSSNSSATDVVFTLKYTR